MAVFRSPSPSPRKRLAYAFGALIALAAAPALALKPFTADYTAHYMGLQGNGTMTLTAAGENRWSYSLNIGGSVAQLSQSTVFETADGQWRPLSGTDSSQLLVKRKKKTAHYDWTKGEARWDGDVKPDRAGPIKLQPGDLDAMLVNLAIVRDAQAGKPMTYRMVDDGKVRQHTYKAAGKETIEVAGGSKQATKVVRADGNNETVLWIVDGMPAPARILQRKNGQDEMDLRLKAIR